MSRALIPPRWPTDRVRLLRAAFRRKILAPRLLYETPAQSRKWLAVHRRWSPAAAARGRRLYRAAFRGIARAAPRAVRVISLGCGSGAKDRDLLEALRHRGVRAAYCPCDVSPSLVGKAAAACRRAALGGCRPLVADLAAPLAPAAFARRLDRLPFPRTPRIVLFLGMLPNFDPSRARRILRAVLRRGDLLVVSANLLPPGKLAERRVMAQYDNRETRAWLLELPRALGWPAHAETLSFRWGRASERRGPRRIEVRYRAAKHPPRLIFFSNRHTRTQLRAFVRALGARAPRLLTTTAGDEGVAWGNVRARVAARRTPSEHPKSPRKAWESPSSVEEHAMPSQYFELKPLPRRRRRRRPPSLRDRVDFPQAWTLEREGEGGRSPERVRNWTARPAASPYLASREK